MASSEILGNIAPGVDCGVFEDYSLIVIDELKLQRSAVRGKRTQERERQKESGTGSLRCGCHGFRSADELAIGQVPPPLTQVYGAPRAGADDHFPAPAISRRDVHPALWQGHTLRQHPVPPALLQPETTGVYHHPLLSEGAIHNGLSGQSHRPVIRRSP
jgi:hypothetical protein